MIIQPSEHAHPDTPVPTKRSFFKRNKLVGAEAKPLPTEPAPALKPNSLGDQCMRLRSMFPSPVQLPAPEHEQHLYTTLRADTVRKAQAVHQFLTVTCKGLLIPTFNVFAAHKDVEQEDLRQVLLIGLYNAFSTFTPSICPYFEVHARFAMRNEAMKLVRATPLIRGRKSYEFVEIEHVDGVRPKPRIPKQAFRQSNIGMSSAISGVRANAKTSEDRNAKSAR